MATKPTFQYTTVAPSVDLRRNRAVVSPGMLTKAVGIDGRFSGAIKPFPGFRRVKRFTSVTGNYALDTIKFFKAVSIQKGNTAGFLRGFVIYARNSNTTQYNVEFHYYDSVAAAWGKYQLEGNVGASADIGVAIQGKYLYYAKSGAAAITAWHDGSSMVQRTMGPGDFTSPAAATNSADSSTGGVLEDGTFLVAYRYKDTARYMFSGLSTPLSVTLANGTATQYVTVGVSGISEGATNIEDFDAVEIYRTIAVDVAGSQYDGGILYYVGETTITDDGATRSWTYNIGKTDADGLRDNQVVLRRILDPTLEEAGTPPQGHVIAHYQGTTFVGGSAATGTTDGRTKIQWSPLNRFNPENFPGENAFRLSSVDGRLLEFVEAGDSLYGMGEGVVYRFQKMGSKLRFDQVHKGRGIVSRHAAAAVDNSLLMVTGSQVLLMDATSGLLTGVGALDRLVGDSARWAGSLSNVSCATDGICGGVFILNPDQNEAVVVWRTSNTITELEDMNFVFCTSGVLPTAGGNTRAFFITDNALVVYPDADRENTLKTQLGVSGTVNGTTDSLGNTTTLNDSTASFDTSNGLQDCYLHLLSGDNAGLSRVVSSNTGTAITTAAFPSVIASGVRYTVSPIPLRVRYWPLTWSNIENLRASYPRYLFSRWIVTGMQVASSAHGGSTGTSDPNALWTLGIYRNLSDSMTVSDTVRLDENPSDAVVALSVDGHFLEPGVDLVAADADYELIAVKVMVQSIDSDNAEDT